MIIKPFKKKEPYKPTLLGESTILTFDQFTELLSCIPPIYRTYAWKPVYVNTEHGTSMSQLLRYTKLHAPFLLIVKDESGFIFGAYGNEPLREISDCHAKYYGSGECFFVHI